jgi:hypothetical protein
MLKSNALALAVTMIATAQAYATQAPVEEEREFPLAIVFALLAVFFAVGSSIIAARSKKKKD